MSYLIIIKILIIILRRRRMIFDIYSKYLFPKSAIVAIIVVGVSVSISLCVLVFGLLVMKR